MKTTIAYRRLRSALAGVCLGLSAPALAQDSTPDMMFVLDLSNSMWGQIDGTSKVEIAKEAFSDFLEELPDGVNAGVMAYGHRRKADCQDVETLVPVSPLDRSRLAASVQALKPRGKTPITDALRLAAEELGSRDRAGRLVLISDGIETCNGDPCALAEQLAKSGVDFKAHVIGFDIASKADQAKIACIAHLTGGNYWNVKDAGGLAEALRETAQSGPDPVTEFAVKLTAADKESGSAIDGPVSWVISRADDETVVSSGLSGGSVSLDLEPGDYVVSAELEEKSGGIGLTVTDQGAQETVLLAGDLPEASVTPAQTEAGATSSLEVSFSGPLAEGDFLRVITPDGNRLERDLWTYVKDGNPARVSLPSEPGAYEIAYVWTDHGERILARAPVVVTEAAVSLKYPESVGAGGAVEIAWTGPGGSEDWIGIIPADGTVDDYDGRWKGAGDGSPLTLHAPGEPGAYEVIYVAGVDRSIMLRKDLTVTEAVASLGAPSSVEASGRISVSWTGPKAADDWIGISVPGSEAGAYLTYERPDGDSTTLIAPVTPGSYELRYVLSASDGQKVLASRPLEITAPDLIVEGPSDVAAGAPFEVRVKGPANGSNWVGLARAGDGASGYVSGAWETIDNISGETVTLTAPEEPGAYELRFVLSGDETIVGASQLVQVK